MNRQEIYDSIGNYIAISIEDSVVDSVEDFVWNSIGFSRTLINNKLKSYNYNDQNDFVTHR